MRRDEVLENRKALPEVSGNRSLDDLSGGFGHESPHAGKLAYLLRRTPRARIRHDEYRIKTPDLRQNALFVLHRVHAEFLKHLVGYFFGCLRPYVYDLVVSLAVGYETLVILLLYLLNLFVRRVEEFLLFLRYLKVVYGYRNARLGRVLVTHVFEPVGQKNRFLAAGPPVADVYELGELLFVHHLVYLFESDHRRNYLPQDDPSDGRIHYLAVELDLYLGLKVQFSGLVRGPHLVERRKLLALALDAEPVARKVV